MQKQKRMPRVVFWCLRIDVELVPAIRRAGYLARARPAVSVRLRRLSLSGVGTPTPRSIALVLQKPSFDISASRCVRSLRLLSLINSLYLATGLTVLPL